MSGARVRPLKHLLNLMTGWFHKGWHLISITVHHGLHVLHRTYTVIGQPAFKAYRAMGGILLLQWCWGTSVWVSAIGLRAEKR